MLGRPVREDSWRLSPLPVMMLKGRPEATSSSGAKVQSLKNLLTKPLPLSFPRLIHAAEHEAMTLVEQRRGAIEAGVVAVLRRERGLQIGGIVNGMRPGVGSEEFVVAVEALAQVGGEAVIDGAAVGVVGIHVAEGDAAGEAPSGTGAQFALNPWLARLLSSCCARATQAAPPGTAGLRCKPAIDGFRPPGRKKFISDAST